MVYSYKADFAADTAFFLLQKRLVSVIVSFVQWFTHQVTAQSYKKILFMKHF